jgi:hypothetical protein
MMKEKRMKEEQLKLKLQLKLKERDNVKKQSHGEMRLFQYGQQLEIVVFLVDLDGIKNQSSPRNPKNLGNPGVKI